jgi:hypothetical protein
VPGAAELIAGLPVQVASVELRGVPGEVPVHRIMGGAPVPGVAPLSGRVAPHTT